MINIHILHDLCGFLGKQTEPYQILRLIVTISLCYFVIMKSSYIDLMGRGKLGMTYLYMYLIAINLIAFLIYGIDKKRAIKGRWRISETTLLALSLFGGGIGSMLSMNIFRHKTKKPKFLIGVPILTVISFISIYYVILFLDL